MIRLQETTVLQAGAEAVWDVISDFGGVASWGPSFIRAAEVTTSLEKGLGARRTLNLKGGLTILEEISHWEEGRSLGWALVDPPPPWMEVLERWIVEPGDASSTVETVLEYRMRWGAVGEVVDRLVMRRFLRRLLRAGHEALRRHLEGVLETDGRPAPSAQPDPGTQAL